MWPHDFELSMKDEVVGIVDGAGTVVARVGDEVEFDAFNLTYQEAKEHGGLADITSACSGPYWAVGRPSPSFPPRRLLPGADGLRESGDPHVILPIVACTRCLWRNLIQHPLWRVNKVNQRRNDTHPAAPDMGSRNGLIGARRRRDVLLRHFKGRVRTRHALQSFIFDSLFVPVGGIEGMTSSRVRLGNSRLSLTRAERISVLGRKRGYCDACVRSCCGRHRKGQLRRSRGFGGRAYQDPSGNAVPSFINRSATNNTGTTVTPSSPQPPASDTALGGPSFTHSGAVANASGEIEVTWSPGANAAGHLLMLFTPDFVGDPMVASKGATDATHTFTGVPEGDYVVVVYNRAVDIELVITSVSVPAA